MVGLKLGTLFYDIGADTSKLRRAQRHVKTSTRIMSQSFKRLGGAIAAAFAFDSIRKVLLLANRIQLLDIRVQNMTKSMEEAKKTQLALLRISNDTGSELLNNVRLFEALTIAGKDIGATNSQVLTLVESLRKLGVIGGTGLESMNNAMLQFGQAMAGSKVRAEEFNSIVENTPLIADAIASGMNLSVGALRRLVLEGKVLSTEVFNSLLKQTVEIEARFGKMPVTIERAFQAFQNNFARVIADFDDMAEVTDMVVKLIQKSSDIVDDEFREALFESFLTINSIVSEIELMNLAIAEGSIEATGFGNIWNKTFTFIKDQLTFLPLNFAKFFAEIEGAGTRSLSFFGSFFSTIIPKLERLKQKLRQDLRDGLSSTTPEEKKERQDRIDALDEQIDGIERKRDAEIQASKDKQKALFEEFALIKNKIKKEEELLRASFEKEKALREKRRKEIEAERARILAGKGDVTVKGQPNAQAEIDEEQLFALLALRAKLGDEQAKIELEFLKHLKTIKLMAEKSLQDKLDISSSQAALIEFDLEDHIAAIKAITQEGSQTQLDLIAQAQQFREDQLDEHNRKLEKLTADAVKERTDLEILAEQRKAAKILELQKAQQQLGLDAFDLFNNEFLNLIEQAGKEHTLIAKAAFLANKAVQVATIIAETEVGAAKAIGIAGPFGIPMANFIRAAGFSSAALVAGLALGQTFNSGGREVGGPVFAGGLHPINEKGQPELLTQGAKQFLLPGNKSGKVEPLNSGMAGAPKITIVNNGSPIDIANVSMSNDEIIIMIKNSENNAVNRVNTSLASGRGDTSRALKTGFNTERNI